MAKFPTYEEFSKGVAEKALDEFLYNGKSIREWMQIIASEDCISRQAVLNYIYNDLGLGDEENGCDLERKIAQEEIYNFVKKMPLVTPQPKIGHWIEEDMFDGDVAYRCSECNELFWIEDGTPKDNEYNFCPKCGKRLVEPTCDTCEYITAAFNPCNACKDKSEYKPQKRSDKE